MRPIYARTECAVSTTALAEQGHVRGVPGDQMFVRILPTDAPNASDETGLRTFSLLPLAAGDGPALGWHTRHFEFGKRSTEDFAFGTCTACYRLHRRSSPAVPPPECIRIAADNGAWQ
jgi:hypothetical protein